MVDFNPGNRIRELRRKAGMTAKDLAERIDTTESTISRIESGKQNLTQAWLLKISQALGVRITELLESDAKAAPTNERVTVCGRIEADRWLESVFYDERKRYDIPLIGMQSSSAFKLAAFEYISDAQGWLIGCEMPKILANDFPGKEFIVCRSDGRNHYELSLRTIENSLSGCHLISDRGDPANRILRVDDPSVCALWRVLMRCEAYFQAPFAK